MRRKALILLPLFAIAVLFFYKSLFLQQVPFPGDLLIAEFKPWRTYSYLGYVAGSYPHKAQYNDTIRQLYPWRYFAVQELKSGTIPTWNPHNFSGTPLLANFQSAALYPLNILFLILPFISAWSVLVVLQPIIASLGMYLYGRKLQLGIPASWFAAFSYGFSSFMIAWLEYNTIGHAVAWLPIMILSLEHLSGARSVKWFLVLVAATAFSIFSGHPQISAYTLLFSAAYALFRRVPISTILSWIFLSLSLTAIQIAPGLELMAQAARSSHSRESFLQSILIQPWQLIRIIIPDFFGNPATRTYWQDDTYIGKVQYIGILPLIFLPFLKVSKFSTAIFYGATIVLVYALTTVNPVSALLYQLPIPAISSSNPVLMMFLSMFSLSVLSGFALQRLIRGEIKKQRLPKLFIVGGVLVCVWIVVLISRVFQIEPLTAHFTIIVKGLGIASIMYLIGAVLGYIIIMIPSLRAPAVVLILCVHAIDLSLLHHKFNPFVPPSLVFPETPLINTLKTLPEATDRVWGYGNAALDANTATLTGIYSTDGYDPLYPREYGSLIHSSTDGKLLTTFTNKTRSDAVIQPGFGLTDLSDNTYRLKIMDTLSVSYVLDRLENGSTEKTFPSDRFSLVESHDDWRIYQNIQSAPKASIVHSYLLYSTAQEFEQQFFSDAFDPRSTVLLTDSPKIRPKPAASTSSAQIVRYEPKTVEIQTSSTSDGILVLTDTYYPGWEAYIDDMKVPILKANLTLRAVELPHGYHTVRFMYNPTSVSAGTAITILSLVLILGLGIFKAVKRFGSLGIRLSGNNDHVVSHRNIKRKKSNP